MLSPSHHAFAINSGTLSILELFGPWWEFFLTPFSDLRLQRVPFVSSISWTSRLESTRNVVITQLLVGPILQTPWKKLVCSWQLDWRVPEAGGVSPTEITGKKRKAHNGRVQHFLKSIILACVRTMVRLSSKKICHPTVFFGHGRMYADGTFLFGFNHVDPKEKGNEEGAGCTARQDAAETAENECTAGSASILSISHRPERDRRLHHPEKWLVDVWMHQLCVRLPAVKHAKIPHFRRS